MALYRFNSGDAIGLQNAGFNTTQGKTVNGTVNPGGDADNDTFALDGSDAGNPADTGRQVTLNADGSIAFTPGANFSGDDWITFRAYNASGKLAIFGTAEIHVDGISIEATAPDNVQLDDLDEDSNGTPDDQQTDLPPNDQRLIPLSLGINDGDANDVLTEGDTVTLTLNKTGSGDVRVWATNYNGSGVCQKVLGDGTDSVTFTVGENGLLPFDELLVQGTSASSAADDVEIEVEYQPHDSCADLKDSTKLTVQAPMVRVDANRDGTIKFDDSDKTSADKPFRFWLNDNVDTYATQTSLNTGKAKPPQFDVPDYQAGRITNEGDLQDYSQVKIKLPVDFDPATWVCQLSLDATNGSPSMSLFALSAAEGDKYLFNETTATQLVGRNRLIGLSSGKTALIPQAAFTAEVTASRELSLLYDAGSAGTGALRVTFIKWKDLTLGDLDNPVISDTINLQFMPIKKMYEGWTIEGSDGKPFGDTTEAPLPIINTSTGIGFSAYPSSVTSLDDLGSATDRSNYSKDYVLLVPGWRVLPNDRRGTAEVTYKRLFWQGFKGRFGVFSWPTEYTDVNAMFGIAPMVTDPSVRGNFDASEMKAYASAAALCTLIKNLDADGYSVNLYAHSLGNAVASEALRLEAMSAGAQKIVHTYVASQAAVSAGAYDPNVANVPTNLLSAYGSVLPWGPLVTGALAVLPQTPDIYSNFPATNQAYFEKIDIAAEKCYNFFNPADGAVADPPVWALNQAKKPESPAEPNLGAAQHSEWNFQYFPNSDTYVITLSHLEPLNVVQGQMMFRLVQDAVKTFNLNAPATPYLAYTAMAFIARSKTKGLGATPGVGFSFSTAGQLDLQTAFGTRSDNNFTDTRDDHSGQFNEDNMTRHMYWHVLMQRCGLSPIDDGTPPIGNAARP